MSRFKLAGQIMMAGARTHAQWEKQMSDRILGDRKRLIILGLLLVPIILGGMAYADQLTASLPGILGGKMAYSPAFYTPTIFFASIGIGLGAGLITGCIGAGGGFIIAPALMSAGVKGIMAVGTDLFHIFAKAIMGSVLHRKLGNICVPLALVFLIGAIAGATAGGMINRTLYELNPVLSDAFITTVYVFMLGFLGFYALMDFLKSKRSETAADYVETDIKNMTVLAQKLQRVNLPPMIHFDQGVVPGGRKISALFLVIAGAFVGLAAAIMGVGGGFLTFPIFVYILGVSSATTVGTDIFQIIFTAGYAGPDTIRHLRVYFLYSGHGHAAWFPRRYPGRFGGDQGGFRNHHLRFLRRSGAGRFRESCLCPAQKAGGHGVYQYHRTDRKSS
jgi:uncharacterized protein